MKKLFYYFFIVLFSSFLISCDSDDDININDEGSVNYNGRYVELNHARIIEAGYDNYGLYNVVQLSSDYITLSGTSRAEAYVNVKIYNDRYTSFSGNYWFDDPIHRIVDIDYYENVTTDNGYVQSYGKHLGFEDFNRSGNIFINNFSSGYIDSEFYFRDRDGKELRGYYTGRFEKAYY